MTEPFPDYLQSTLRMLSGAYPNGGMTDEEYYALIEILLEGMSFHGISSVLQAFLPKRQGHYNDVCAVAGGSVSIDASVRADVRERLGNHGLAEWLAED